MKKNKKMFVLIICLKKRIVGLFNVGKKNKNSIKNKRVAFSLSSVSARVNIYYAFIKQN